MGCAQAVAEALREGLRLDEGLVLSMSKATGGRAPLGYCGAVYAAMKVAEEKAPHRQQDIEAYFLKEAGGLTCREIRSERKLLCADCVEQAARLLSEEPKRKEGT